jgi:hypothetical protein
MVDNDARRADNRQWDSNSGKIRDGHLKISAGIAPDPLKMKEARGPKGIRIEEIHQLQQEIFEAACLRGEGPRRVEEGSRGPQACRKH